MYLLFQVNSNNQEKRDKMEPEVEINISNKNSDGQVVLNDQKLLDLIIKYPFLYNPYVRPQNEHEYVEWAWHNITASMNKSYTGSELLEPLTNYQLMARWEELKPIISSLMKAQYAIPSELQQIITKMHIHLQFTDQKPNTYKGKLKDVEKLIRDNIQVVERLSRRARKHLEADVLDLLLKTELDIRGTKNLGLTDKARIRKECNIFLKEICFKNPPSKYSKITVSQHDDIKLCYGNNHSTLRHNQHNGVEFKRGAPEFINDIKPNVSEIKLNLKQHKELCPEPSNSTGTEVHIEQYPSERKRMLRTRVIHNKDRNKDKHIATSTNPLVPFRIKKCRVRIKRIILEDLIPLGRRFSLRRTR